VNEFRVHEEFGVNEEFVAHEEFGKKGKSQN